MIRGSCHCGAVRFELPYAPEEVTECNCTICTKLGALWAYYEMKDVRIHTSPDATIEYVWNHRMLGFHTCKTCGCTAYWLSRKPDHPRLGVNARLVEGVSKANARIRYNDNAGTGRFWL